MRTAVDLFCGAAGGWTLGLHWAGVQVVDAVELDDERAAAYAARWGIKPHKDVRRVHGRDFRRWPWLLAGSPPCKGISEVNHKGKGVDDDGLFFEAIRLADESRPDWVALENVPRLRTRGADRVFDALEAAGYSGRALVVGSGNAGADHQRERAWIVAANTARRKGWLARQPWRALGRAPTLRLDIPGPGDRRAGVRHLRPEIIGRHLRAYDGVPDRVAEQARHAYGDALDPMIPMLIAQALIRWEQGDRFIGEAA